MSVSVNVVVDPLSPELPLNVLNGPPDERSTSKVLIPVGAVQVSTIVFCAVVVAARFVTVAGTVNWEVVFDGLLHAEVHVVLVVVSAST